jgi:hypothetical protein
VTLRDASSFMRRVICYNQGEYAQYNFLAGELHKRAKDFLRDSPRDVKGLRKRFDQLERFLNRNLGRISQKNFKYIRQYFSGRHDVEPRICIKANYERGGRQYIVQVIRDKPVNYSPDDPLDDDSGFLSVRDNGRYFSCPNIPEDIATDKYHNARIDTKLAQAYYKDKSARPIASNDGPGFQFDESWIKCWRRPAHIADTLLSTLEPSSCYKSTVIIPMTLWNNELDSSFLKMMNSKAHTLEVSRTIFGYLCFDHVETHYFNDDVDIDVGYIFADLLSLYMITRSIYTKLSETFAKALTSFSEEQVMTEA